MVSNHHCIVTPEIPCLVQNGGVGANCWNTARFLAREAGKKVTIVFLRPSLGKAHAARSILADEGIEFVALDELSFDWQTDRVGNRELRQSLACHWWLQKQPDFAAVHFMHYECGGFAAIRAKRLGTHYHRTPLTLIINSPTLWLDAQAQRRPAPTAGVFLVNYMEQYTVEHADFVVAPTRSMFEFMDEQGWRIQGHHQVLPTTPPELPRLAIPSENNQHLVFFGRLETRKGIGLFMDALELITKEPAEASRPLKITFLGKISAHRGQSSETFLRQCFEKLPRFWQTEILSDFNREEAMQYLEEHSDAIFVIPSLADNSPNTALECLQMGLRVLAADSPGLGELFASPWSLFEPTPHALATRICEVRAGGLKPCEEATPAGKRKEMRLEFLQTVENFPPPDIKSPSSLKVSVIVTHFNLGNYLNECVLSLLDQDYSNVEILVVDDGSTEAESLQVLKGLEAVSLHGPVRILRQENGGVCAARNHGAECTDGDLLLFMDADNVACPQMISTLVAQLQHAGLDALSCDLFAFQDHAPDEPRELIFYHAFAGGSLEASLTMNLLGDAHCMMTREAFNVVGGFRPEINEASSDRAFLVRLIKRGFKLDCTHEKVFLYRIRKSSMSRTEDHYYRAQAVLNAFTEDLPRWAANALSTAYPIYKDHALPFSENGVPQEKLLAMREKFHIERDKRRFQDRLARSRYQTLVTWRGNLLVRLARFLRVIPRDY